VLTGPSLVKELVGDDSRSGGMELREDAWPASQRRTPIVPRWLALEGLIYGASSRISPRRTLVRSGFQGINAPAAEMAKMAS